MRDLQLNFFLNLSGHPVKLRENQASIILLAADRLEQSWPFRKANRGEQFARLPSIGFILSGFFGPRSSTDRTEVS
jgi:hypothetical protein